MNKNILVKLLIVLVLFSSLGCQKEGFLAYDEIDHNSEWLFPIVKTRISPEQVSRVNNIQFDIGAFTGDIPFIDTSLPISPILGETIGPLPLQDPNTIYARFRSGRVTITINITNNFPINIKAGSRIEIRNSRINNDVVYEGVLESDIPEKGGKGAVVIEEAVASPWVDNDLELFITSYGSDGSTIVEDFNAFDNIEISLNIQVIEINEVELFGNIDYSLNDTIAYRFGDNDEADNINPDTNTFIDGGVIINLLMTNATPLNYVIQGHFLDENFNIVGSLFNTSAIVSPDIDGNGRVITSSVREIKIETEITEDIYENIRNKTRYISYDLGFSSQPQNIRILPDSEIRLHVTIFVKTPLNF